MCRVLEITTASKLSERIGQGCGNLDGEMQTAGAGLFSGLRDHIFGEIRDIPKPERALPAAAGRLRHIHIPGQAGAHPLTDCIAELPAVTSCRPAASGNAPADSSPSYEYTPLLPLM
jgi:hypothetical protein